MMKLAIHISTSCVVAALASFLVPTGLGFGQCTMMWDGTPGQPGFEGSSVRAQASIQPGPSTPSDLAGLFVGGGFSFTIGTTIVNSIGRWNGTGWRLVGSGTTDGPVQALAVFDDGSGSGPALFAGGLFTTISGVSISRVAKWNGLTWSSLGSGIPVPSGVNALAVFDDGLGGGPALYVGGAFTTAGGISASNIARWDGTMWSALGQGTDGTVTALTVHDDGLGSGPALYVGGAFASAGGAPASRVARWNGASWSALGGGVDQTLQALAVYDDGSGPALYVGGNLTLAGGAPASGIAKWDGATWSALGQGTDTPVLAMHSFDDGSGSGPELFVGGSFTTAGGQPANRIAKWNGSAWSTVSSGMDNAVRSFGLHNNGSSSEQALYVGGNFSSAGGVTANRIARWRSLPAWGACCVNGIAIQATEADCLALNGEFHGVGVASASVTCAPACLADLNGSGIVNGLDLAILLGAWGPCPSK